MVRVRVMTLVGARIQVVVLVVHLCLVSLVVDSTLLVRDPLGVLKVVPILVGLKLRNLLQFAVLPNPLTLEGRQLLRARFSVVSPLLRAETCLVTRPLQSLLPVVRVLGRLVVHRGLPRWKNLLTLKVTLTVYLDPLLLGRLLRKATIWHLLGTSLCLLLQHLRKSLFALCIQFRLAKALPLLNVTLWLQVLQLTQPRKRLGIRTMLSLLTQQWFRLLQLRTLGQILQ